MIFTTVFTTNSGNATALSFMAFVSYFAGLPAEVVLGAFSGAVIFVTSATEFPRRKRLMLSGISFIAGVVMFRPFAMVLIGLAHNIGIDPTSFESGSVDAAGALVSAIVSVKIGMKIYGKASSYDEKGVKSDNNHE